MSWRPLHHECSEPFPWLLAYLLRIKHAMQFKNRIHGPPMSENSHLTGLVSNIDLCRNVHRCVWMLEGARFACSVNFQSTWGYLLYLLNRIFSHLGQKLELHPFKSLEFCKVII